MRPSPALDDESLIAALRLASGRDPVPGHVSAAARAAFALRLPGAVTARPVPAAAPAGVRAAEPDRLLRFGAGTLTVDLEVGSSDGLVDLAGQVSPWPGAGSWIEVRTPCLTESRELSPAGQFAVTGLPPGWFSVVCHHRGHPPVATSWTRIRP
ncbi:hypothetical protein [Planomonospora venezuelensis]|uniref:Uncharacterized protein n=1 Tax=Planomonospora venezuelensis TaxID=1999 RepID=A0A841DAM6_PLAVE|nr:hypothetical protein [Planomonospora venezuelensis]MBB5965175.1 hypothetical protein [Planomonospora venezuelensis]GIN05401.1 hypothetical protein Pve01_70590 [Planomonospora venezuelensis]